MRTMSTPDADDCLATGSLAVWSLLVAQGAAVMRDRRLTSARLGPWLGDLGSPLGKAGLSIALGSWLVIIGLSAPGHAWSAAQEAWCYWIPSILDPYRQSDWTSPVAYVYSPAFLELIAPLRALSWTAFVAVWTALLLGAVIYLTGPRLLWLGVLAAAAELYGGNISLFLAVAIVLSVSGGVTANLIGSGNPSTIAANIALAFPESSGLAVNALIASGLVLFAVTLAVNMAARAVINRQIRI